MAIIETMTQAFVDTAVCPVDRIRFEFVDASTPGLYLLCSAAGRVASFFYRGKQSGKLVHFKLGRTTEINLQQARAAAMRKRAELLLGVGGQKAQKASMPTLDAFFQDTVLPQMKTHNRSWERSEELYRLRIKRAFGHLPLNAINKAIVSRWHSDLLKKEGLSGASADHHVKLIRRCCSQAVENGILATNPLSGIKLFNFFNQKTYCLSEEDLGKLVSTLRAEKSQTVPALAMLLVASGTRLGEAMRATYSQMDMQNLVWRIPAENNKGKRVRSVPLTPAAVAVIEALKARNHSKSDYLFVNPKTGTRIMSVHKRWDLLRKKAGLPHLRIHDLRHSFASFLVNDGRTLYEVQQILGHSDPKVTMRYAHLSGKAMATAANSASVKITDALRNTAV